MPDEVRDLVVSSLEPASYRFGSVIVREGNASDSLYIVRSGRARAVKAGEDGTEISLNTFGPGDTFGEMGLLHDTPRQATVRASSDVEALVLDRSVFRALIARNAEIREYFELDARHRALRTFLLLHTPFAHLSRETMATVLRELQPVSADPGAVVIREGDAPGPLYVVEEGRLLGYRQDDGERRDIAYYRKGDVFGERSLLSGRRRAASVEAVSACRLLALPPDTFRRLLDHDPVFRTQIESWVTQYDYQRVSRVPVDFGEELLPAEAEMAEKVGPDQVKEQPPAPPGMDAAAGPFETADGQFAKRGRRIRRFRHIWQVDEADCGAACLAMVCRHHGRQPSLSRVRKAVWTSLDGTSLRGITQGAEGLGLHSRGVKASRRNLDEMPLPAIAHWDGNHWVVVYDVGPRHVRLADPATGLRRLSRQDFDAKWTGYTALFEPGEAFEQLPESPRAREWLLPLFRPYRRTFLTAVLLALAVSGMQMVLPVFIQVVVDRVLPSRDFSLLRVILLSMAALLVVATAGSLAQRYLLSRAAVRVDGTTLDFLTGKLLALPLRYFYARRTGDIQRRLMGMRLVREFAVQNGVIAITSITQLLVAVVLMVVYSPQLALVFLATAPLYVVVMRVAMRRLRPVFDSLEEAFGKYASRQVDAIKGIETVKALGAEPALRRQLVEEFSGLSRRLFRADFTSMVFEGAVQLITFASLGVFLWIGSLEVLAGRLSVGELVAFNALVVLANGPIVVLLFLWDQLQLNSVLVNRLSDVFEEEPEQGADHSALVPVRSLEGRVRLDNLGFQYGGPESPRILEGISFDVAPGTTVAIVGRSGSGKTTLVKCLAGLLEPTDGQIRYDGVDLRTLDYRELRQRIGFVLQENYLFSDTIAANIAFGAEPDPERVEWAARVANAHEFIARLPFGYQTKVGESGLLISGGQRQRIAIARALYRRPPILILDEATSSLDTESERAVKDNLDRLLEGRTTFVIAHRLSTVRDADLILVLERGRLVERGSHDELMARRGLYFYLSSQQLDL